MKKAITELNVNTVNAIALINQNSPLIDVSQDNDGDWSFTYGTCIHSEDVTDAGYWDTPEECLAELVLYLGREIHKLDDAIQSSAQRNE